VQVLLSTYLAYAGFYLVRKVFGIIKTTLVDDYDIGFAQIANIWTAFLVAYMLGQFINSFIGRRWGPRVLLIGGLGQSIVFNVIFGFANSYYTFLIFMFFNGLVQAAGWPGAVGGVAQWLRRKERGTIMGFWSTSYLVGNIVVKMWGGFLLLRYTEMYDGRIGVRYTFLGCTLVAFGIWWLIFFFQRDKPEDVGLDPIVDHQHPTGRAVAASTEEHVGFKEYSRLLLNPIVPLMGVSYFSIKFLRYSLDSWLPTFLDLQGMNVQDAAWYSSIFDYAGLAGAILAGITLDWVFNGRWEIICLGMGVGMVCAYLTVLAFGTNAIALAVCFGMVGFMIYGPDTLLCGAASVSVAGQRNAVAVAGLVNGIGSMGPVVQEQTFGFILEKNTPEVAVSMFNGIGLALSMLFVTVMVVVNIQVAIARRRNGGKL
jgi:OPA family sugar phosphate sensor protein UhpC-like MFS transporter